MRKSALTLGLTALVLTLTGVASGDTMPQKVLVANGTSQPVPVQAVGTLPTHEQGTANVNITNTSVPVTVVNASQEQPFKLELRCGFNNFVLCADGSNHIPANKTLVIQTVSGSASVSHTAGMSFSAIELQTSANDLQTNFEFVCTPSFTSFGFDNCEVDSREVTIYADAGSPLGIAMHTNLDSGGGAVLSLSGYLEPTP